MWYMKTCNARHEGLPCDAMARKNFNTTIDEGTIEKIERLAVNGRSKGEVIDIAVGMLDAPKVDPSIQVHHWFRETWERLDEIAERLEEGGALRTEAPLGAGIEELRAIVGPTAPAGELPKNARCVHCGERFAGARTATCCIKCATGGHSVDVRDCRPCAERVGAI